MKNQVTRFVTVLSLVSTLSFLAACAGGPPVKAQKYARLSDHRVFEYEFPVVWKAVETTFKTYKVVDRNPEEVDALEMKKLKQRTLESDWIYAQSRDKYIEFKVN